jgi:hypothetical protein
LNLVLANCGEMDEIYPLTTIEIAEAQKTDQKIKIFNRQNAKTPERNIGFQLSEDTKVLCRDNRLIIPASLQHRAVS